MPDTLTKVQSLLLQAASMIAKLQTQPETKPARPKRKPKPNAVEQFVATQCFDVPGAVVPFTDFFEAFIGWLPPEDQLKWTKQKVIAALPVSCAFGKWNGNVRCVGNVSLADVASDNAKPLHVKSGRLFRERVAIP